MIRFTCKDCAGITGSGCVLTITCSERDLDRDRPDWRTALRRCPFEDSKNEKLTGYSPKVNWRRNGD